MSPTAEAVRDGLRDVGPMLLGVVPYGMIAGVAASAVGLPPLEGITIGVVVFAGAAQLAAFQLLTTGAPLAVILLTAFFVNLRFVMYSAALAPWLRSLGVPLRLLLAYLLTDQGFAFSIRRYSGRPDAPGRAAYYLAVAGPVWLMWGLGVVAGVLLGAQVPPAWSLDFASPLVFIALLFPTIRDRPGAAAALVAACVAVAANGLPLNLGLVTAALCGILTGGWLERRGQGADP